LIARGAGLWIGLSVVWIPLAFLFDGVTVLVLPLRVGGDASALGLVSLVGLGVAAGLQPIAGWLSDRLRDRVDRRTFLAVAAVPAIVGAWLLVGTATLGAVVAGYILIQAAATSMQAAQQTLIPEHLERAEQGRASGLKTTFDVGGSFLAFLVLGALLASGEVLPAATVITVLVVVAVTLVFLLVPSRRRLQRRMRPSVRLPEGLGALILARFLFLFATYGVGRFMVLLVAERLGLDPSQAVGDAAGLLALFTLTTASSAVPVGWLADRRSQRDIMVAGAVIAAAGIAVLVPPAGLPGVFAGGLLMSLGTAAFVTANWAATTTLVGRDDAGRLMAIANLGTGIAAAAAGALGPVIDAAGFAPALLVAATASGAAVIPILIQPAPIGTPRETPA
jgi:MFS family permease